MSGVVRGVVGAEEGKKRHLERLSRRKSGTADEGWDKKKKEEEGSETQDGGTEEKIEEAEKEKEQELKKVEEEVEKGWLFVIILPDMWANST